MAKHFLTIFLLPGLNLGFYYQKSLSLLVIKAQVQTGG